MTPNTCIGLCSLALKNRIREMYINPISFCLVSARKLDNKKQLRRSKERSIFSSMDILYS